MLGESIPLNLILGSLKVYKVGLRPLILTKLIKGKDEEQCRPLQLEIAVSSVVHYPEHNLLDPEAAARYCFFLNYISAGPFRFLL